MALPCLFPLTSRDDPIHQVVRPTRRFFEAHFPALQKPVPPMVLGPQSFGSPLNHVRVDVRDDLATIEWLHRTAVPRRELLARSS